MKIAPTVLLILFLYVSCGKDPESKRPDIQPEMEIQNWARPGVQGQMSGAYFTYKNPFEISDTLVSIESPQAMMTQIHESYTTEDGLAGMREKKEIIIAPGQELVLKQGGLHVMLMNLNKDLSENDSVKVSLTFSQIGTTTFTLPVKRN